MGLILLEALLALVVLVAIVWWTMFSGRRRGELIPPRDNQDTPTPPAAVPSERPGPPASPPSPEPPPRP